MITKSIVDLNLIASFANAFEMPFVTPWFPEKTGGGFFLTGQVGKLFWQGGKLFWQVEKLLGQVGGKIILAGGKIILAGGKLFF